MAITINFTTQQQTNITPKRFGVLRDGDAILEAHQAGVTKSSSPETPAQLPAPKSGALPAANLKRGK
jgi:hypothetical protein